MTSADPRTRITLDVARGTFITSMGKLEFSSTTKIARLTTLAQEFRMTMFFFSFLELAKGSPFYVYNQHNPDL